MNHDHTNHESGESHDHHHHGSHHGSMSHRGHEQMFRRKFWVSLALSIPILYLSPFIQGILHYSAITFPGSVWVTPVVSIIIFAYGGVPFLKMARTEFKNRAPGMMMLISLAITVAFIYSLAALLLPNTSGFFWELATLIDIMLLGHWIEMRSVRQASGALDELAALLPDTAERISEDDTTEEVPVDALETGDHVLVRPGATIPADGTVFDGDSRVNEAMITGESRPVDKSVGDEVIGGTINTGSGSLRIDITATGDETALSGIMRLVEEAQHSKSQTQLIADKAAGWLFYVALGSAIVTAVGWVIATGFGLPVLERAVTVLVIACPHALGLAVPLVVAINTSLAAKNGILIRDRIAMESARNLDVIMFDKTGTLTKGEQGVVRVETNDVDEEDALGIMAGVEGDSEHPIAQAIRQSGEERVITPADATQFEAIKGRGVTATVNDTRYHVGGPNLLKLLGLTLPRSFQTFAQDAGENGQAVVYLIKEENEVVAGVAIADVIREESRDAITALHDMGVEVAMLTGDSEDVAKSVAEELGIDTYFAEVLPEEKDSNVAALQEQGKSVGMVGDGVNDAPALTRADVGIAIGSGTDVAVESADIVLVKNNPLDVVKLLRLSHASYRKMVQNLFWAAGYNVFAIPLAAGILAPFGILLSPAVGALLMSASTVIVAANAQLLRRTAL